MTARDLAAFIADLRDYNSGVARATYAYDIGTSTKCHHCKNAAEPHQSRCVACIDRDQARRDARKDKR